MPKVRRNAAAAMVLAVAAGLNAGSWLYGTARPVIGFGEDAIDRWAVVFDLTMAAGMLVGGLFLVHLRRLGPVALAGVLVAACGQFGIAAGASGASGETALLVCDGAVGLGSGLSCVAFLRLLSAGATANGKTLGFAFAASGLGYLASNWTWDIAEAVGAGSRLDMTRPVALTCGAITVVLGAVAAWLVLHPGAGTAEPPVGPRCDPHRARAMAVTATVACAFAGLAWAALGGVHGDATLRSLGPELDEPLSMVRMAVPLARDVFGIAAPIVAGFLWERLARWPAVVALGLVMIPVTALIGLGPDIAVLLSSVCAEIVSSFVGIALIVMVWRASGERLLHWISPALAVVSLATLLFHVLPTRGFHWIAVGCAGWAVVALAGVALRRNEPDRSKGGDP